MPSGDFFRALREKRAAPFGAGSPVLGRAGNGEKKEPFSLPSAAAWAEIPE